MRNESTERRYLQTAGLPLDPLTKTALAQLLDVDKAHVIESTDSVLFTDPDGSPIGRVDFMPNRMQMIRDAEAKPEATAVPDPSKGDTVVRKLEPGDPRQAGDFKILHTDNDPPPIDLPDWQPDDEPRQPRRIEINAAWLIALASFLVCAGYLLALATGG